MFLMLEDCTNGRILLVDGFILNSQSVHFKNPVSWSVSEIFPLQSELLSRGMLNWMLEFGISAKQTLCNHGFQ